MQTRSGAAHLTVLGARSLLAVCALAGAAGVAGASPPAEAPADIDPVMGAMAAELERTTTSLALPGYEAPYYTAYRVEDLVGHSIGGRMGAVDEDRVQHSRDAWVDVRVGGYDFDSSEDDMAEWPYEDDYEPPTSVPIDGDAAGLRHTLWLLTDLRYKQALSSYMKLKGQRVFTPDKKKKRPSNTRAEAVHYTEAPVALSVDAERWRRTVKTLGNMVATAPAVFDNQVLFRARVQTRWFVTNEGIRLRTVAPLYEIHVQAWVRTDDGMLLDQSVDLYGRSESRLPDDAELERQVSQMLADLEALRLAPELEPYTGPAILEPAATGVFFHEVLGHRLEGHRQDSAEEGQTFADHLGQQIMPSFLSVLDDPTRATEGSVQLNGAYRFDDEGVRAQEVTLVRDGVLEGFLMSRRPVSGFDRGNGHGRAQGTMTPVSRMGNLIVRSDRTVSDARLRKMLLAEARRQGKPYALIIRDITGGSTNTSSYGYQAFKGGARMVYKVDARTGAETLVRGVEIVGTPLTALGKIMAAGDTPGVFNGYCGAESGMVPVSTIAPATLFSEIELQRSARGRAKGPILGSPGGNP
ncbi:MAG: TldD/PmbA family protein [Deltaproteobacteria bacterium]|nr:TldD/PmbA family protein [Deltaproteobacteria bacterium]